MSARKRYPGESFKEYRKALIQEDKALKQRLKGKVIKHAPVSFQANRDPNSYFK